MSQETEALKAVVRNRYAANPDLRKLAELGADRKADTIAAMARKRVAAGRKQQDIAARKEFGPGSHAKPRGVHIVTRISLRHTPDGPLAVPHFLGKRLNITLHATTDARPDARTFNGRRDAERAAQLQGDRWEAVPAADYDRSALWSRVEPGPAEIPQVEIDTMALERGLSL